VEYEEHRWNTEHGTRFDLSPRFADLSANVVAHSAATYAVRPSELCVFVDLFDFEVHLTGRDVH
jgi:hypothetical protein